MTVPFTDLGQTLHDFAEIIYVRCPQCQKYAQVRRIPSGKEMVMTDNSGRGHFQQSSSPRKVSCLHCSYTRTREEGGLWKSGPCDWYFHLPLWLQTPCCREILWAFNEEHLSFLEGYVTAKQRIKFNVEGQIRNQTMASKLPIWIKKAKNRNEVLKGIARLKVLSEIS